MNYKRYIPKSILAAALLMMAGCATDRIDDEPVGSKDDTQFWIQFQMSALQDAAPQLRPGEQTRADNTEPKSDEEVVIKSLMGLLFDVNNDGTPKSLVATSQANTEDIVGPTNKVTTVTLNMGLNSYYQREQKYRLFVVANLPDANYSALTGMKGISYTDFKDKYATLQYYYSTGLANTGISLGTAEEDGLKIMVYLRSGETYDKEHPYLIQVDSTDPANTKDDTNPATLALTPMQARFDIVKKSGMDDYKYPINFNDGENVKPEVYVEFTGYQVATPSQRVYYFQKGKESDKSIESPTFTAGATLQSYFTNTSKSVYVPEFVPAISGTNTKLKFNNVTYVILRGILVIEDDCTASQKVKDAINSKNQATMQNTPLYYYDDGNFQSALTTTSHAGEANWQKITYDAQVQGYGVTYRHAVRHNAGTDKDSYDKLEYGVLRNYIYQIGVESVKALPHPFDETTTPVEDDREDISIRINPPEKWKYHRLGTTIKFD